MTDYPAPTASRPVWLVTLADLALLLLGFVVLVQATQGLDRRRLAKGFRDGFGATDIAPIPVAPISVAANGVGGFARASAVLPVLPPSLSGWTRDAIRDPRVQLTIAGSTDGTPADVDPATGSAVILASDRARALAAALAPLVPATRMTIVTAQTPAHTIGRRAASVTMGFAGEQP